MGSVIGYNFHQENHLFWIFVVANQATLLIKIFGPFADLSSEMANFFNQTFINIASSSGTGGKNRVLCISKEIGALHISSRCRHPIGQRRYIYIRGHSTTTWTRRGEGGQPKVHACPPSC